MHATKQPQNDRQLRKWFRTGVQTEILIRPLRHWREARSTWPKTTITISMYPRLLWNGFVKRFFAKVSLSSSSSWLSLQKISVLRLSGGGFYILFHFTFNLHFSLFIVVCLILDEFCVCFLPYSKFVFFLLVCKHSVWNLLKGMGIIFFVERIIKEKRRKVFFLLKITFRHCSVNCLFGELCFAGNCHFDVDPGHILNLYTVSTVSIVGLDWTI